MQTIKLTGYQTNIAPYETIVLGTSGSYGIEKIELNHDKDWDDLEIVAIFNAPNHDKPIVVVSKTNVIDVPAEATQNPGKGIITFAGYADGVRKITVDVCYIVYSHGEIDGDSPVEPAPDIVKRILDAAKSAENSADSAKESVRSIGQIAENAAESANQSAESASNSKASAESSAKSAQAAKDAADSTNVNSQQIQSFMGLCLLNTKDTFTGSSIKCTPTKGIPISIDIKGKTTQAGSDKASLTNIRNITGIGESGSIVITTSGQDTENIQIPLASPLYDTDSLVVDDEGKVVETHRAVKLTVDGSENWISWTNPRDTADITVPGTIGSLGDILCSHYSPLAGTLSSDAGLYTVSTNTTAEPGKTRIILRHGFKTRALFKEYLKAQADAGKPVTFVYKLKPTTTTPVVSESRIEPVIAKPDSKGVYTVNSETDMTISYKSAVGTKMQDLENRIAALEAKS